MSENDIKAELSYAYLHAIAARAGFACQSSGRLADGMGIDAQVLAREKFSEQPSLTRVSLEIQLKATSSAIEPRDDKYSFELGVEHYNKLREPGIRPLLLVVLFLPEDSDSWLEQSAESLISKRCAYWVALLGAPEVSNTATKTIYIPESHALSVSALRDLMKKAAIREEFTYEG